MYLNWTSIIVFLVLYTIGIRLLMGSLIKKSQLTVSEFMGIKDQKFKNVLDKMIDSIYKGFENLDKRLEELEEWKSKQ